MSAHKDYYKILGIPKKASQKDIKAAYRKLALKYHPDQNSGSKETEAKFVEINEANEVLSDPQKREKYDNLGPGWEDFGRTGSQQPSRGGPNVRYTTMTPQELESLFGSSGSSSGNNAPFSDFFYQMFGTPESSFAPRQTAPSLQREQLDATAEISLEESYNGTTRVVSLDGGNVEIKIPAGIKDGGKVRVKGVSNSKTGAVRDLFITAIVKPSNRWKREGDNLLVKVKVPLKIALLGGEVAVPTPKGNKIQLKIKGETQNGQLLRLRGLGFINLKSQTKGDLIAEVDIQIPIPLSPELLSLAEHLP